MASALYSRLPLSSGNSEVRILEIEDADGWDEPLKCSLRVVSLKDDPKYRALSYCWGKNRNKNRISCDGVSLKVSDNLDEALRHVRHLRVSRLWVDQLCINQQNPVERNQQILLMHEIYAQSRECLAYLGTTEHDKDDLRELFRFLETLREKPLEVSEAERANPRLLGERLLYQVYGQITVGAGFSFKGSKSISQDCMFDLISQPYFSRVWVIQELVFSKRIRCLWGRLAFDWKVITAIARGLPLRQSLAANTAFKKIPAGFVWHSATLEDVNNRTKMKTDARAMALEQFTFFAELIESFTNGQDRTLISLLEESRMFQATDHRDKVFAMLNIATDNSKFPKADYRWSLAEVYRKFAGLFADHGQATALLPSAGIPGSFHECQTWVPNWSEPCRNWNFERSSNFTAGFQTKKNNHSTSKDEVPVARLVGNKFILPKYTFDIVDIVCPFEARAAGLTRKLNDFTVQAAEYLLHAKRHDNRSPADLEMSVSRLLFCDSRGGLLDPEAHEDSERCTPWHYFQQLQSRIDPNDWKSFVSGGAEWLLKFSDSAAVQHGVRIARNSALNASELQMTIQNQIMYAAREKGLDYLKFLNTVNRTTRVAKTVDGLLGLVPESTVKGDHVTIVPGLRAPVILHPRSSTTYEYVGQAYIRRAMYGEMMPNEKGIFQDVLIC